MLKSWAEENLGKYTVFDIDTDPDILGGVILSTKKGLYKDLSLSKKLNDVFAEKRKEAGPKRDLNPHIELPAQRT